MQAASAVVLLLAAGCAVQTPAAPVSERAVTAMQAVVPQPGPTPAGPTPSQPAPAAPPALNLDTLEKQLKETKAIGLFTKLTLKNQIDDLLDQFRDHYKGKKPRTMKDLRGSYDLLMMKVLSLLQDEDEKLASDIVTSREAIWALLADPKTFATLEV